MIKDQIEVAIEDIFTKIMPNELSVKDCKPLVERVSTNLKDIDERWIEFDQAPRIHANPVFSHIYQRIYRRLVK